MMSPDWKSQLRGEVSGWWIARNFLQIGNGFPKYKNMIPRMYQSVIEEKLQKFPSVAILGPRQCGKTTLAQQFGGIYFDMETEGSQTRLDAEWDSLVSGDRLIVIDEAQQAPEVFRRLRGTIDSDRKRNGRFLLLGSVSPEIMSNVSESLAGRMGLVRMTPLVQPELPADRMDDLWLFGGYPDGGICLPAMFPEWQRDYLDALAYRDLPNWGLTAKPSQTLRLLGMLAVLHGQPLNMAQLGGSLSLDHKTVLRYCDFLQSAFLIRRVSPFFTNIKKRLLKTPRLYWRDSGLLHALMNVTSLDQLYSQPWLGHSWEGFVIEQTLATLATKPLRPDPFFFRTSDGYELDLLLDWATHRDAIEIKLTSNPGTEMVARLNKAADLIGAEKRILICRIDKPIETDNLTITNLPHWLAGLQKA
jgi:predicted AAA+ superfamily ATPase